MQDGWNDIHKEMVADAKARANDIKIVFAGDSITSCWTHGAGLKIWNERYAPLGAINLGISSDVSQNLLWRLQNGVIEPLHPKMVMLLIGSNNMNESAAICQCAASALARGRAEGSEMGDARISKRLS